MKLENTCFQCGRPLHLFQVCDPCLKRPEACKCTPLPGYPILSSRKASTTPRIRNKVKVRKLAKSARELEALASENDMLTDTEKKTLNTPDSPGKMEEMKDE